ncbi:IspD/TarI family cytidylyltransferase [Sphingobacterium pedocola]|nr:IspD/TarI family cytidylyltransferase [Sphingobacterium pedocola]
MINKQAEVFMNNPKAYAIILASGIGNRCKGDLPKQFTEIAGRPLLMHTLDVFHHCPLEVEIILVLHAEYIGLWEKLLEQHDFEVPHEIVLGGKERCHSAQNALSTIPECDDALIAIHDGVRPFVAQDVIIQAYAKARLYGAVIPAISTVNPIRLRKDDELVCLDRTFDRSNILTVQTPQVFKYGIHLPRLGHIIP